MNNRALVLVVDDTPSDALLLSRALSKAEYQVIVASNSEQCLAAVEANRPDIILLDMSMPDRDGIETCRILKSQDVTASIPVIFITGNSESEHILRAFGAGGSDYVTKPIRIDEILARLSLQIRLRKAEQSLIARNGQLEQLTARLAETNAELGRQARLDALTLLLNRSTWEHTAAVEHQRAARHKRTYGVLMLDIDYFKLLNDSQGHQVGDEVLQVVARAIADTCRQSDLVGRYGGEEFVVLAPESDAVEAAALAERVRQAIWNLALPHQASPAGRVTISIGVAAFEDDSLREIMRRADKALYLAKRGGRNLICGQHAIVSDAAVADESAPPAVEADIRPVILVIEDNATNRRLYRACLERDDYRVIEAENGVDGLDTAIRELPDVIIMDVMMPAMDGLECTRRLKAEPETRDIPIIMASARSEATDILVGLEAGADEYVTKPIRTSELAVRVRSMVRLSRERKDLLRSYRLRAEQVRVLTMLVDFCRAIGSDTSFVEILDDLLCAMADLTCSRRLAILLPDASDSFLKVARSRGIDAHVADSARVPIDSRVAGRVFLTCQPVVFNSQADANGARDERESIFFPDAPLLCAPIRTSGETLGVLTVADRVGRRPFEPLELEYVELVTNVAASALQAHRDRQRRDDARDLIVVALARLAEHRDNDTARHVERVAIYSVLIAAELRRMNYGSGQIDDGFIHDLQRAVPLHDIGKVAIPDNILRKPGRLTVKEMEIMRSHATIGVEALRPLLERASEVGFFRMAMDIIHAHHEWYDGSGYPRGLKGDAIPLAARIAAVADVFDALTTHRVYKDAVDLDEAETIILNASGTQFDPAVVEAFVTCRESIRARALELADKPNGESTKPKHFTLNAP